MQRLSLIHKLILLCVIWSLPVIILLQVYQINLREMNEFSQAELEGTVYVRANWLLLNQMLRKQLNPSVSIDKNIAELSKADRIYSQKFLTADDFSDVQLVFNDLKNNPLITNQTITPVLKLIQRVANKSNITDDPGLDSYFVGDIATEKLPRIYDFISKILDVEAKRSATEKFTIERKEAEYIGNIDMLTHDMQANLESVYRADSTGQVRKQLTPTYADAVDAITTYKEALYKNGHDNKNINLDIKINAVLKTSNTLFLSFLSEFQKELKAR